MNKKNVSLILNNDCVEVDKKEKEEESKDNDRNKGSKRKYDTDLKYNDLEEGECANIESEKRAVEHKNKPVRSSSTTSDSRRYNSSYSSNTRSRYSSTSTRDSLNTK